MRRRVNPDDVAEIAHAVVVQGEWLTEQHEHIARMVQAMQEQTDLVGEIIKQFSILLKALEVAGVFEKQQFAPEFNWKLFLDESGSDN